MAHRTEVKQRPLISLFYGSELQYSSHFQPFSNEVVTYEGRKFNFLDSDITDTNRRQCQHSSVEQSIKIRTNPESSQDGVSVPGTIAPVEDLEVVEILQLIDTYNGLKGAIVEIIHSYLDNSDKEVRKRYGLYQIVSTLIKDGLITFRMTNGITPLSPIVPAIRRIS